jgi:hypothetical protein
VSFGSASEPERAKAIPPKKRGCEGGPSPCLDKSPKFEITEAFHAIEVGIAAGTYDGLCGGNAAA